MTPSDAYDPSANSLGCYQLAIRALREQGVREGRFAPLDDDERRQAAEGPRASRDLDCVRQGR